MASASGGNRLVFKPSPLKAPPLASASAAPASVGHGNRDDVTLFIPGKLDGATLPFLQTASRVEADAPPAADAMSAAAAPPTAGRLGLYLAIAALLGVAALAAEMLL